MTVISEYAPCRPLKYNLNLKNLWIKKKKESWRFAPRLLLYLITTLQSKIPIIPCTDQCLYLWFAEGFYACSCLNSRFFSLDLLQVVKFLSCDVTLPPSGVHIHSEPTGVEMIVSLWTFKPHESIKGKVKVAPRLPDGVFGGQAEHEGKTTTVLWRTRSCDGRFLITKHLQSDSTSSARLQLHVTIPHFRSVRFSRFFCCSSASSLMFSNEAFKFQEQEFRWDFFWMFPLKRVKLISLIF